MQNGGGNQHYTGNTFIQAEGDSQFVVSNNYSIRGLEWSNNIIFGAKNGNVYLIDKKHKYKSLLFLGNARTHSVQQIGYNSFLTSNMDGQIVVFKLFN